MAINVFFFGLLILAIVMLYMAAKIAEAKQKRAVEESLRRHEAYLEEVRTSRRKSVKRKRVKRKPGNETP